MNCCGAVDDHQPLARSDTFSMGRHTPRMSSELMEEIHPAASPERHKCTISLLLQIVGAVVLYVPFLLAILIQSLRDQKVVRTLRWKGHLDCSTWLVAFLLYGALATLPLVMFHPLAMPIPLPALDTGSLLGACYAPILFLHLATVVYIYYLPQPSALLFHDSSGLPFTVQTVISLSYPFVEALQLYAIGLTMLGGRKDDWSPIQCLIVQFCCIGPLNPTQLAVSGLCMGLYIVLLGYMAVRPLSANSWLSVLATQVIPGTAYLNLLNFHLYATFSSWDSPTIAVLVMESFLVYVLTAPFVAAYKVPDVLHAPYASAIRITPRFLVLERVWKGLLVTVVFLLRLYAPSATLLHYRILIGMVGTLLIGVAAMQPCSASVLNQLRFYTLACILFSYAYAMEVVKDETLIPVIPFSWAAFSLLYCFICCFLPMNPDEHATPQGSWPPHGGSGAVSDI